MGFRLRRKPRPGVASDGSDWVWKSPAGCGELSAFRWLSAASCGSTAFVAVENRKACSPTPARYAHTRAVAESSSARPGSYPLTTPVARSDWTAVGGFAALRMSRPPCGEAERPGPTRRGLTILHPDDCPSPNLRQSSTKSAQCSAHPAEGWQVTAEVSEKSPVRLCVQRRKSAFLLDRARPVSLRPKSRPDGRLASDARLRA